MKIAILTNGPRTWPSSRLRGYWYQDADPLHFNIYAPGDPLDGIEECEVVIFQKRQSPVDVERAARYQLAGKKVIYDITEPMWWWYPAEVEQIMRVSDCITVSSEGLRDAVKMIPFAQRVEYIPDRMLASTHPTLAQHEPRDKTVITWFGSTGNRLALEGYLPVLGYVAHLRPLELRIIDSEPGVHMVVEDMPHLKVTHIPWKLETYHAQLTDCDIAYLPEYPGPWGAMKSNNREVTAMWTGLPFTDGMDMAELLYLIDHREERKVMAAGNRAAAETEYETGKSIKQLLALAEELTSAASGVKQGGGMVRGPGLALVGEPGPEILTLPDGAQIAIKGATLPEAEGNGAKDGQQ